MKSNTRTEFRFNFRSDCHLLIYYADRRVLLAGRWLLRTKHAIFHRVRKTSKQPTKPTRTTHPRNKQIAIP